MGRACHAIYVLITVLLVKGLLVSVTARNPQLNPAAAAAAAASTTTIHSRDVLQVASDAAADGVSFAFRVAGSPVAAASTAATDDAIPEQLTVDATGLPGSTVDAAGLPGSTAVAGNAAAAAAAAGAEPVALDFPTATNAPLVEPIAAAGSSNSSNAGLPANATANAAAAAAAPVTPVITNAAQAGTAASAAARPTTAAAAGAAAAEPVPAALEPPRATNAPLIEPTDAGSSNTAVLTPNATANAAAATAATAVTEPGPFALKPQRAANAPLDRPTVAGSSSSSDAVLPTNATANAAAAAAVAAAPVNGARQSAATPVSPATTIADQTGTTAAAARPTTTAAAAVPIAATRPTTAAVAVPTAAGTLVPAPAVVPPPVLIPQVTQRQIPVRPRPATAPGPLGAPPPGTAAAAAATTAAVPGNHSAAAAAAAPAATTPQQSAWSAGWHVVPDDDDLLISADNDHDQDASHQGSSSSSSSSAGGANATAADGKTRITILHFNDWHMRTEPTKESYCALCNKGDVDAGRCNGGLARMSTYIKQQRQLDPDLLVLNAGDDFIGTEWDRKTDMDAPAAFMNMLGVDAMTVGNHEWDKGLHMLEKYIDNLNTTRQAVLGANVDFGGHNLKDKIQRYVVKEVKGKKICILGLTTEYGLPDSSKMSSIKIQEPYYAGRQVLEELKSQGCHAQILLSHLGYTSDLVAAKMLYGLDVVIGGHSHSFLWPDQYHPPAYYMTEHEHRADETWGPYPTFVHSSNQDVPVVQASWGSRYMGRLVLEFDEESKGGKCSGVNGAVVLLGGPNSESHVDEDPVALQEIEKWKYW